MDEASLRQRISDLVDREHRLRQERVEGRIGGDQEHDELAAVEVELDQLWDLLRRRAARRHAGEDPAGARSRPAGEVEGYLQ